MQPTNLLFFSATRDSSIFDIKLAENQSELPAKRMLDSYREASIPLGTNHNLRGKYVSFYNTVRIGRIMEDLDTMAGENFGVGFRRGVLGAGGVGR